MDNKQNRYLSVSYQLFTLDADGSQHLVEQTQQGRPFTFISGFGFSLDGFEKQIADLQPGQNFDFTLSPAQAFGEYDESGVRKVNREMFTINGHFDHENIYPDAVITLMDSDEHHFMARVVSIDDDGVTLDTNHPLAGQTLKFQGVVLENRDATNEEIQNMLNHMSHECGGCGCDDCGGECGHDHEHSHDCGCGHCHH
ncbi:MAG: FKBP-type peptidyl-prolyl cis-trans isomerase [Prevotella sp.]|nr:FKBP-type peptidyl-prolyl cis-trans isomerase [Prevotella sp.]